MSNYSSPPTANNIVRNITKPFGLRLCRSCSAEPNGSTLPLTEMIMKGGNKENILVKDKEKEQEDVAAMKRSVKAINFGGWEEKAAAAAEIKRLARADGCTRRRLGELGVVQPLVTMIVEAEEARWCRGLAVEALVELAKGTFRNKKLIVEAGLLAKLPQLIHNQEFIKDQQFAHLLFSVSSLAKTQFPIESRHFVPFLIEILNAEATSDEGKLTSIATLYNLSTKLDNTRSIVASGAVHSLLTLSINKRASEGALATLSNLAASATGKKAIEDDPLVLEAFVEILEWDDKPRCQEFATYLLMVIAHRSAMQRQKMLQMGIVAVLLKVALLGSPVARKRALKLLQWFKDERQCRLRVHSGPQVGRIPHASDPMEEEEEEEIEEGQKAVKTMVKQSLDRNMELLMKRANGLESSSGFKSLVASSSSKSLPY